MIRSFVCVAAAAAGVLFCPTAGATETLTIGTYNIHGGIPDGFSSQNYTVAPADVRNIADVVTSMGADLLALQEVKVEWKALAVDVTAPNIIRLLAGFTGSDYIFASTLDSDNPTTLTENTDYLEWGTFSQWTNNGAPHGEYGNGVLSKLLLKHPARSISLPMANPAEERRGCVRTETSKPVGALGPVVFYSTHFQNDNAASRELQMREILKHATADAAAATVFIAGDLNYSPSKNNRDLIAMAREAGFYDLAAEHAKATGGKPADTIPAGKPNRRIDYVLCSKQLAVEDVTVFQTTASDHLPLRVRVKTSR